MTAPTMDDAIVEAVARAIHEGRNGGGASWLSRAKAYKQPYLGDARAALTALCAAHPGVAAVLRKEAVAVAVEASVLAGLRVLIDPTIPPDEIHIRAGDVTHRITNIAAAPEPAP